MRPSRELLESFPPECDVMSWPNALENVVKSKSMLKSIVQDCASAATARSQISEGENSHGITFWVGANDTKQSKTTLERLALSIFHSHLQREEMRWLSYSSPSCEQKTGKTGIEKSSRRSKQQEQKLSNEEALNKKECRCWSMDDIDLDNSGAEWWTLCMDEEDGGVGWHWDKDYHAELQHGKNIHPFLGTVSYFSDCGAPTIVFPKQTSGPMVSSDDFNCEEDYNSNSFVKDTQYCFTPPQMSRAYISRPLNGKHIYFDGRLLHAAPVEFYDKVKENITANANEKGADRRRGPRPKRATLLVNIWINHKPRDAISINSLSSHHHKKLSKLMVSLNLSQESSPLYQIVVKNTSYSSRQKSALSSFSELSLSKEGTGKKNNRINSKKKDSVSSRIVEETTDVDSFSWHLNKTHQLHAKIPVKAIAKSWSKEDTFLICWNKGTQRPFIEETQIDTTMIEAH